MAIFEIVHLEQFGHFCFSDSPELELLLYMSMEQRWRFWLFWAIFGYFQKCTLRTIWTFLLEGPTRVGSISLHVNGAKLAIFGNFGHFLAISENVHFKLDEISILPIWAWAGQFYFKWGQLLGNEHLHGVWST